MLNYSVSQKIPSLQCSGIFLKRLGIFNQFLHTYYTMYVPFYSGLQILIPLFPTLTKLCHTKRDRSANFLHFTRTLTSNFAY